LFIVFSIVTTSQIVGQGQDNFVKVQNGTDAPGFTVKTIDGGLISLDQLRGKTVILTFFATWCSPCMEELPHLERLYKQHKSNGLVILCIGREHQLAELQLFNQTKSFTFNIAADPDRKIYQQYADKFIPRTFVIDRNGKILYQSTGYNPEEFSKMEKVVISEIKR